MLEISCITGGSIQTNCYLLNDNNNVLLIDYVPEAEKIIVKNNFSVDKIFLTHIHFDHFENLSLFQKKFSFELGLSKTGYEFLKNPDMSILSMFPPYILENYKNLNLENCKVYADGNIIEWNGHNLEVFESPGHSPDCLMYILREQKTVFTGDTIFLNSVGRTDLPGGSFNDLKKSVKRLFDCIDDDYILLPGHGDETTVSYEKENNFFLNR